MNLTNHKYLGDGVYASFDGYQIWLHVGSHTSDPVVALEPEVLKALNTYSQDLRGVTKQEADHKDTGGPDQGGEFVRGMPGHPDNDMGM